MPTRPPVEFFTTKHVRGAPGDAEKVCVALQPDRLRAEARWDDFGYRTRFKVFVSMYGGPFVDLGEWKILERGRVPLSSPDAKVTTELPERFSALSEDYLSLAQDIACYETLSELGTDVARAVLTGLRDVSVAVEPENWQAIDGFTKSLVRFTSAHDAWLRGPSVLRSHGVLVPDGSYDRSFKFQFQCQLAGFARAHDVDFGFSSASDHLSLRRLWAIVGKNGTGKTHVMGELARAVSGLKMDAVLLSPRPAFSKVIALSYSAWDDFPRPREEGAPIAYVYGGLRARDGSADSSFLDVEGARRTADHDLATIRLDEHRLRQWRTAFQECRLDRVHSPLADVHLDHTLLSSALRQSSAGQQFAAIVLTRLVAHLEPRTLVLFDEPELHMHPNLLSGLLRALHVLLEEHDSFALIATQSPIPLQEIPASCVRLTLLRHGSFDRAGHEELDHFASFGISRDLALASPIRS